MFRRFPKITRPRSPSFSFETEKKTLILLLITIAKEIIKIKNTPYA